MANMQVTDVTSMMFTEAANMTAGIENSKKPTGENDDFSKVLEDVSKKTNVVTELDRKSDKNVEPVSKVNGNNGSNKVKTEEVSKKDPVNNEQDRTEAAKSIVEKATNVKDKIKENFGISDEELTSVMEEMGMSLQDLLNPDMLKDLMTELSGVTDSISLITDADLYANVKSVMEVYTDSMNELTSEYGVDATDIVAITSDNELFASIIAEMEPVLDGETVELTELTQEFNEVTEEFSSAVQVAVTNEVTDELTSQVINETVETVAQTSDDVNKKVEQELPTDKKIVSTENSTTDNSEKETITADDKLSKMPTADEQSGKGRNEGFEGGNSFGRDGRQKIDIINESAGNTQTVSTTSVNNVGDIIETITSYSTGDNNEIVSQVTESIKVNLSNDSTSLEMMLHPASLGTVNMQVSSTNGVITAQILVENEAVRAALESQLITLQDSFEAAGHKVDAVEVSVANYDLNKGMNQDQNQKQGSKDHEDAFRVMGSRRRINLNIQDAEEEAAEEMDEEEKIARDMMARNGNTVDYTV